MFLSTMMISRYACFFRLLYSHFSFFLFETVHCKWVRCTSNEAPYIMCLTIRTVVCVAPLCIKFHVVRGVVSNIILPCT